MKYPFPKNTLYVPLVLLAMIWGTFALQALGLGKFNCYGIVPRNWIGLRGIIFSPLFHSGWKHIISNTFPLIVLSFFAVLFYQRIAYYVIIFGWIFSGLLVWIFGNLLPGDSIGCHIGASNLVYLLASFVFFGGIFKGSRNLIAISLIVVFLYGSMVWGVIPEEFLPNLYREGSNRISWEGHLSGAIVGFIFAFLTKNHGPKEKSFSWEENEEMDEREQWIWQRYKESLSEEERRAIEKKYGELTEDESSNDKDKKDDGNDNDYWFKTQT